MLRRAFTAIEMVTVIAIIGVLAAMAVPAFASSQKKSRLGDAMDAVQRLHRQAQLACRQYVMSYNAACPTAAVKIANSASGTTISYLLGTTTISSTTLSPSIYLKSVTGASTTTAPDVATGDITFTYASGSASSPGNGSLSSIAASSFTAPAITDTIKLLFATNDGKFDRTLTLYQYGFIHADSDVKTR